MTAAEPPSAPERPSVRLRRAWRSWAPLGLGAAVAVLPPPAGLPAHAWHLFAIFLGVVAALVLEPVPNAAVGLVGVSVTVALSRRQVLPR